MNINVGISNRHIHLTEETFKKLYGEDYEPTVRNDLSQPGELAYNETLTIKTEKSNIDNVRILGPFRDYNQVEITKTDAYKLGLKPPVRNSGDVANSESATLVGPNGEVTIETGVIIATRHIHINDSELEEYGLANGQIVNVKINTDKGGIMSNVYVKSSPNYAYELHLDTDDANAFLLNQGDTVEVIKE